MVLIQHPLDLDAACSLALLQEEVVDGEATMRTSTNRTSVAHFIAPRIAAAASYLPQPTAPASNAEDRQGTSAARATSDNNKIAALRTFRCAQGLCFKCGEHWGKDHTYPTTVQMHIIEELRTRLVWYS